MHYDLATLVSSVFVFVSVAWPALLGHNTYDTDFYKQHRKNVPLAPPPRLFQIVWALMYALLICAEIVHIAYYGPGLGPIDDVFIVIVVAFFLNLTLAHFWPVVFFQYRRNWFSFIVTLLMLATAIVVGVLYAVAGAWISFGLYLPYALWLVFAMVAALIWAIYCPRTRRPAPTTTNASTSATIAIVQTGLYGATSAL
jgi:tryptophan-rich sensory protein